MESQPPKGDGEEDMQASLKEEMSLNGSYMAAPYILWPPPWHISGASRGREAYFAETLATVEDSAGASSSHGRQARSLMDLLAIRAMHSKSFRHRSLGTALGFRTRCNQLTDSPAIIVLVSRKLHRRWVVEDQLFPRTLTGPAGVWCDVDVVEFAYFGGTTTAPREQIYSQVVENVRGNDTMIGVGSQVAGVESYGTLGALVCSRIGFKQVGFLTNRHVAVDLEFPCQKIFHPLPPSLGPGVPLGVYLGSVQRATSYVTDEMWYGVYASMSKESFVRADGAFVPFTEGFDVSKLTTCLRGLEPWELGDVINVELDGAISDLIGKRVVKLGRSSGVTKGTIAAYSVEYYDEKGNCFFTDFLIVGDNEGDLPFDLEGDCGSLILLLPGDEEKCARPIGLLWGGTANRGKLKLRNGLAPDNWTSGIDLGRLLDLLKLDLIKCQQTLKDAFKLAQENQRLVESVLMLPHVKRQKVRESNV